MKNLFLKFKISLFLVATLVSCSNFEKKNKSGENNTKLENFEYSYRIPAGENSWIPDPSRNTRNVIQETGIENWKDQSTHIKSYF